MTTPYTQLRNLPLPPASTIASRTYIVTGANTGLGLAAAQNLALLGAARVILAVRNTAAGEAAKKQIDAAVAAAAAEKSAAGVVSKVEVWYLDLSVFSSINEFVKRAEAELERVDGLIENAAVAAGGDERAEGHRLTVAVNVVGTLLLGVLMLPVMARKAKEGERPRVVVVTSRVGFDAREEWEGFGGEVVEGMDGEGVEGIKLYSLSKLAETFAVRHLARELIPVEKTGVIVNLICPGLCITDLARHAPPEFKEHLRQRQETAGRTADDGSRTLLHGVTAGAESHGKLLHSCDDGEKDVPDWVKDDLAMQKNTWEAVAKELEKVEPGCVGKLLA